MKIAFAFVFILLMSLSAIMLWYMRKDKTITEYKAGKPFGVMIVLNICANLMGLASSLLEVFTS